MCFIYVFFLLYSTNTWTSIVAQINCVCAVCCCSFCATVLHCNLQCCCLNIEMYARLNVGCSMFQIKCVVAKFNFIDGFVGALYFGSPRNDLTNIKIEKISICDENGYFKNRLFTRKQHNLNLFTERQKQCWFFNVTEFKGIESIITGAQNIITYNRRRLFVSFQSIICVVVFFFRLVRKAFMYMRKF